MKKIFMEKKLRNKFLFVFLSFSLAVLIYLLFRSRNLFYYQIVKFFKIDLLVNEIRPTVWVYRKYIPNWVLYALPDGLWLFSMGVSIVYNTKFYKKAQFIYTLVFLFMIFIELFQNMYGGHGTFVGTFDKADIICYILGYILASLLGFFSWKSKEKDDALEDEFQEWKKERKRILIYIVVFASLGFFPSLTS